MRSRPAGGLMKPVVALLVALTAGRPWSTPASGQVAPAVAAQGPCLPILGGMAIGAVGGSSWDFWRDPYYATIDPRVGPVLFRPQMPTLMMRPRAPLPSGPPISEAMIAGGLDGIPRPRPLPEPIARPMPAQPARRGDASKSAQLITLGDRLFRAENLKRSTERYVQALVANPQSATPRVRLAQLAVVRGHYAEAANHFREAQAAEPGWLLNAPDIQAIYAEPGDFSEPIARLETHLQIHPGDRDAWLVLGAQWYLSGRTRRAADIFLRLTDRPTDPTLSAFLAASTPRADPPEQ